MARSSYIYVVLGRVHREVLGTFTVKHEMMTVLNRKLVEGMKPHNFSVLRFPDGRMVSNGEDITNSLDWQP